MFNIITIGDSTVDNFVVIDHDEASLQCDLKKQHCKICFNYADKIPIKSTAESVGGNAANVAVGARKLGLHTAIVSELGDDINGSVIIKALKQSGVNTKFCKILPKQTTRFSVVLHYQSERTILSYHVQRKYSLPKLPATDWLYYTSLGKSFEKLQTELVNYLKQHPKTKLALNPGSYQMKHGLKKIKQILPYVDFLFVNKEEAEKLIGQKKNIKLMIQFLLKNKIKIIAITDGEKGAWIGNKDGIYHMPIYPIPPIAKTGAGDAFASGLLSALILGKKLETAIEWGTANACGVVQHVGSQKGLLNQNQINTLINQFPKIKPRKI